MIIEESEDEEEVAVKVTTKTKTFHKSGSKSKRTRLEFKNAKEVKSAKKPLRSKVDVAVEMLKTARDERMRRKKEEGKKESSRGDCSQCSY